LALTSQISHHVHLRCPPFHSSPLFNKSTDRTLEQLLLVT
jgi:hypothetical protein